MAKKRTTSKTNENDDNRKSPVPFDAEAMESFALRLNKAAAIFESVAKYMANKEVPLLEVRSGKSGPDSLKAVESWAQSADDARNQYILDRIGKN